VKVTGSDLCQTSMGTVKWVLAVPEESASRNLKILRANRCHRVGEFYLATIYEPERFRGRRVLPGAQPK